MRKTFDIAKAIPQAWAVQWKKLQDMREKHSTWRTDSATYLTAADIESQVRTFAEEEVQGRPWGASGPAHGRPLFSSVRISLGSGTSMQYEVRSWLLKEVRAGRLESFNFGKESITGMRFRPAGMGLTETERKTMEQKARAEQARKEGKRPPMHFSRSHSNPLCTSQSGRMRFRRSNARMSHDWEKVDCPRCLKLREAYEAKQKEVA